MTVGSVLVVGGTGPTGVPIVNNFLRAGARVTIFHSGAHEAEFEDEVEHLHSDARDSAGIRETLGGREWEIAVCTSGRLRALADELAGRTRLEKPSTPGTSECSPPAMWPN